jgi:hypothetical protein
MGPRRRHMRGVAVLSLAAVAALHLDAALAFGSGRITRLRTLWRPPRVRPAAAGAGAGAGAVISAAAAGGRLRMAAADGQMGEHRALDQSKVRT